MTKFKDKPKDVQQLLHPLPGVNVTDFIQVGSPCYALKLTTYSSKRKKSKRRK